MKRISLNPFKRTYSEKDMVRLAYFSRMRIFEGLTQNELSLFLPYLHERHYKKNEVVFFRGDPSLGLYIIKTGVVALSVDYQDELEQLTKVEKGNTVGESCLLPQTKRLLNAIVFSETSDMYVIPQLNIIEIFENNLSIKSKMLESLSKLYHEYNHDLFEAYRNSLGFFHLPMVYKYKEQ